MLMHLRIVLICTVLGLQACTPPMETRAPQKQTTLAAYPGDKYLVAAKNGEPVYAINTTESDVVILVYRGGVFAKMGHNHVVTSRDVHGFALLSEKNNEAKADLYVPLKTLIVDETAKRARVGFESVVSEKDIAGTRQNMLEKVLEAESFPYVFIHVESESIYKQQVVKVDMTLHGVTRSFTLPVEIEQSEARLSVSGKMVLRQSDFGMKPFSVLGGALRVKDEIILNFQLHATRL